MSFPTRFCGRIVFAECFFFRSVLKFRSTRTTLMRVSELNYTWRRSISFPTFQVAYCSFRELHAARRSQGFWAPARRPGRRNLIASNSSVWQQNFATSLFGFFFLGLLSISLCIINARFTIFASRFCSVILAYRHSLFLFY